MNTKEAWALVGGLSKPSKMPGWAIGIPAAECKTGNKLKLIPNSVCSGCYAEKGCYVFAVVQAAQYKRLKAIAHPQWVEAMATLINSKKPDVFRWHDSGDVQDVDHLEKIFKVCELTPSKRHWMPTREAWIKDHLEQCPKNLIIRLSMTMIYQAAAGNGPHTSTVTTKPGARTCPAPDQGGQCGSCRQCWSHDIGNIAYGKH